MLRSEICHFPLTSEKPIYSSKPPQPSRQQPQQAPPKANLHPTATLRLPLFHCCGTEQSFLRNQTERNLCRSRAPSLFQGGLSRKSSAAALQKANHLVPAKQACRSLQRSHRDPPAAPLGRALFAWDRL